MDRTASKSLIIRPYPRHPPGTQLGSLYEPYHSSVSRSPPAADFPATYYRSSQDRSEPWVFFLARSTNMRFWCLRGLQRL